MWRNANSSQCWPEPNTCRKGTLQAKMMIFCIPEPKRRTEENCHGALRVCRPSSLSLPEPWRPGLRASLPWLRLPAGPAARGVALVGVQAMWSPFQESAALPHRGTVLLKPQGGDWESAAGDTVAASGILSFQNCGCRALGTSSLSTQLRGLGMTDASLSPGSSRNGSNDPSEGTGENWLEDPHRGQKPEEGLLTIQKKQPGNIVPTS